MIITNSKFIKMLDEAFQLEAHKNESHFVVLRVRDKKEIVSENPFDGILAIFDVSDCIDEVDNGDYYVPKELLIFLRKASLDKNSLIEIKYDSKANVFIDGRHVLSVNLVPSFFNYDLELPRVVALIENPNFGRYVLNISEFAVGKFERMSNQKLKGILFECDKDKLTVGATDTTILSCIKFDCKSKESFSKNIPRDSLRKVAKFLNDPFEILSSSGFIYFKTKDALIRCNLLGYQYPKIFSTVSKQRAERTAIIKPKDLIKAIEAIGVVEEELSKLFFEINDNAIRIYIKSQKGESEYVVSCRYGANKAFTLMAFHSSRLLKCLRTLVGDEVKMFFNENAPVVFEDNNHNLFTMIMPLEI